MIDGEPATVSELWRYPVKSMQGERLSRSRVTDAGFAGDRAYALVDVATGNVASAKHPRLWGELLHCAARYVDEPSTGAPPPPVVITLADGGETRSDDPDVDGRLSAAFGRPVRLATAPPAGGGYLAVWPHVDGVMPREFREQVAIAGDEPEGTLTGLSLAAASPPGTFFDVAALHIIVTASILRLEELEPGSRFAIERFRPNAVVASTCEPFAENGWAGATVELGGAGLTATVAIPTMRCIMTTLAQGPLPRDNHVLRTLADRNRVEIPGLGTWSCLGAYAAVTAPGSVALGDEVSVRATPT